MHQISPEILIVAQLVNNFAAINGTRIFIFVF
jgi:hypothetical protein